MPDSRILRKTNSQERRKKGKMNESSTDDRADRLEARQERREARRAARGGAGWLVGGLLILVGLILFGQNLGILAFENWWALFILIPAVAAFATAARMVEVAEGRFTRRARTQIIIGLVLIAVTAALLFELAWTLAGPGLLILSGIALVINALLPD
jgi:cation transport ATPase